MKDVLKGLTTALVLLFMLCAYLTGGAGILTGLSYAEAKVNNPDMPANYTQTHAFRSEVGRMLDSLYTAVTANKVVSLPSPKEAAYYAFGLSTNRVSVSDENALDLRTFEDVYKNSPSYSFYVSYSAGVFKGFIRQNGQVTPFEIPYSESAGALFDTQRDYPGAVLALALLEPQLGISGLNLAKLEFLLLENGITYLIFLCGLFFVSLSIVFSASPVRRRISKTVANGVAWIYWEIRLPLLLAAFYWVLYDFSWPLSYLTLVKLLAVVGPVLYLFACRGLYSKRSFFSPSLFGTLFSQIRRLYDGIYPILPLQIKLRQRILLLFILGLVLPFSLFFLIDAFMSLALVRLLIPFYLLYFGVLLALFVRHYGTLVNGVSELIRYSALLPKGGKPPANPFAKGDDLYELADNMSRMEDAIAASTEKTFAEANSRLAEVAQSLEELKEQFSMLSATAEAEECNPEETISLVRRMQAVAERMTKALAQGSPINAPVLKRMDLLAALDDVMNARLVELSAAKLKIDSVLPPPPAFITADMNHIRAALDILICNLAKHALSDSVVQLALKEKDAFWHLTIVNETEKTRDAVRTPGGLLLAEEYLNLNGGKLEIMAAEERFGVSVVLPRAH